jgi:Tfp pilus assembly protein PilZ
MAASITQAVEEFLVLNQRYAACGLDDDTHVLWSSLARRLEGALVTHQCRGFEKGPRRHNARAPLHLRVRFSVPSDVGSAETLDLSAGGCALQVGRELERGSEVEIVVTLPQQLGSLTLAGWISWCAPARQPGQWRLGVTFAAPTQRERDLLAATVLGATLPRFLAAA